MNDKITKPYINLQNTMGGGILSLFMYDKGVAKHLSAMAEEIMRRPSTLSIGERELIAAFTSKLNECAFCYQSHAACAKYTGMDMEVENFLEGQDSEILTFKMRTLLSVAACVQSLDRAELPKQIQIAKDQGATDQEIHDTVIIASFFCMCNRYVDGLGTTFKPEEPDQGGASLAKYGYLFGVRRFFGEVLPKMIRKIAA